MDKKKIWIIVFSIILISLISLCAYSVRKFGKMDDLTPTGNIDIFEINCNSQSCKDKDPDNENNNPDPNDNDNQNPGNNNNGQTNNGGNPGNNGENNNNNNNNNNQTDSDPNDDDDDKYDDDKLTWVSTQELRIFENPAFGNDKIIAPGSTNSYQFNIRNSTDYNLSYNINVYELNPGNINMKYRLKRNDNYITGDDWVSANVINFTSLQLSLKSEDVYVLEWKWFDSSNDTSVGINTPTYNLKIDINAIEL